MFHRRAMEHRINRIHERTLRLIYPNQHQLTFKELLEKKTRPLAQRNFQTLATEIYKAKNKISAEAVNTFEFEFTKKKKTIILEMLEFLKGRNIFHSPLWK